MHKGIWTTNYNIFVNIIDAVWDFPMYLFNNLFMGGTHGIYLYSAWYKIFVLIVNIYTAFLLKEVMVAISGEKQADWIEYIPFLYLVSPVVQIGSIGIGQIDFMGVVCALFVVKYFLSGKYYAMSVWISISLVLAKPFLLFFYIPVIIYLIPEIKQNTLKCMGIIATFPLLSIFLETVVIRDYLQITSEMNKEWGFFGRLFEVSVQNISIFMLISGVIMYYYIYKVFKREINKADTLFYGLAFYAAFIFFVHWHFQWLLYGWWALIIAGLCFKNRIHFYVLYMGISIGSIVYCTTRFQGILDNAMFNHTSALGNILLAKDFQPKHLLGDVFLNISEYSLLLGKTVLLASICMILIIFYQDTRSVCNNYGSGTDNKEMSVYELSLTLFQGIPMVLFIAYTLIAALGN